MNKSIIKSTNLFVFALIFFAQLQAQVKPVVKPGGGIINPTLKAAIAKQAAIDKILNAELVKVDLVIKNDNGSSPYIYNTRSFLLRDDTKQAYFLTALLGNTGLVITGSPNYKHTYSFMQNKGVVGKETYRELLTNGMTVTIDFNYRKLDAAERYKGEYKADFFVTCYFADGTMVDFPLQDINLSKKGTWTSKTDLKIVKRIEGSAFPDPANPLVLPNIK